MQWLWGISVKQSRGKASSAPQGRTFGQKSQIWRKLMRLYLLCHWVRGKDIVLASAMSVHWKLASRVLNWAGSVSCRSREGNRIYTNLFPVMKSFPGIDGSHGGFCNRVWVLLQKADLVYFSRRQFFQHYWRLQ